MNKVFLVANTDWYLYNFRFSLAKYLRKHGYSVVLVSPDGMYVEKFHEEGFRWIEWNVGRQSINPWKEWAVLNQLKEIYRHEKPDIVHHHTIKPVLYGSLAARSVGIPHVINSITGRGYVFGSNEWKARILRPLVLLLYRKAFGNPNCTVIFENQEDQQDFIRRGLLPEQRTRLVRSVGVDLDKYSPTPEPNGIPVVIMASRMLWDKGVGVFVDAARILKGRVESRMVLVGSPDEGNPSSVSREQLEQWAEEGVVEWWGWQDDMAAVYAKSNIYVLPSSYFEGVPTSLIEAGASGRALIASDIPGCREVIQHEREGLLVSPEDADALAGAIIQLVQDPELRARLAAAARARVVEGFSSDRVNQETEEIYWLNP
ncbi:MAG TPA: glycosyltransferase family 4 protein [Anaerolineaceae bacterium]|nr:glycosyltransferase family 4 protein [Anaerolineaceae bacterium]